MKRNIIIAGVLAWLLAAGCKPENFKPVGKAGTPAASLAGTWKISKVTQKDENAANFGWPYQVTDLTSLFPYTDFTLTLNMNGGAPATFTTTPGQSPRIITIASGNWSVDDPVYPKVLTLAGASDTATITLGSYPTEVDPTLKITLAKHDAATGRLLISYSYVFVKQ
ncbi:MAG TPA: DUF5004 domain-containing protein [Puia sp.]|nr:DUF5004 domain-containing protein [Puia sp.]